MEHVAIQNAKSVKEQGKPNTDILCRFSKKPVPPFEEIGRNDTVYLKLSNEKAIKWRAKFGYYWIHRRSV